MSSIQLIETKTAKEFWSVISPEKQLFDKPYKLVYRGQADASLKLEPSLFRKENKSNFFGSDDDLDSGLHMLHEILMLQNFVKYCDATGIPLPNDSRQFRQQHLELNYRALDPYIVNPSDWPNPALYELMAIAQHHGMPTRLLDWSSRSFIAAYFAAAGALQFALNENSNIDHLALWALNLEQIVYFQKDLDIVHVPSGFNKNISSQAGCFTVLRQKAIRGQPFEGTHLLDEYLQDKPIKPLIKITVPVSEADDILELCHLYGVSHATIFPDLYGAAQAVVIDTLRLKLRELKHPQ